MDKNQFAETFIFAQLSEFKKVNNFFRVISHYAEESFIQG
jgi:hypothetical protein